MQAEADKRKVVGVPEAILESRSLIKGKDGNCLHFRHEFGHRKCMDCGACLEQWRPDWSQAPDGFNWFAVDSNGHANFYSTAPYIDEDNSELNIHYNDGIFVDFSDLYKSAESFDYKGDWRDSLRERPL